MVSASLPRVARRRPQGVMWFIFILVRANRAGQHHRQDDPDDAEGIRDRVRGDGAGRARGAFDVVQRLLSGGEAGRVRRPRANRRPHDHLHVTELVHRDCKNDADQNDPRRREVER